jgi:plasmid stabilization system protein ParE
MSRKLIVAKEAEADILDGYLSYEEKQKDLGRRFLDEIEIAFNRILLNPLLYQEVEADIRRAVAHTFPYLVFYTFDEQTVQILAVIHGAQNPAYINARLGA